MYEPGVQGGLGLQPGHGRGENIEPHSLDSTLWTYARLSPLSSFYILICEAEAV